MDTGDFNGNDIITQIRERWNKSVRSFRIWGFIAAVLMIVVGIVCVIYPVQTTYALEIIASIALLCLGVWQIVRYFQFPVFLRTGAGLVSGILNVILGIMLLTSPAESVLLTFGFLFGFDLLLLGIEQISKAGRLHAYGVTETGWLTADGVLNLIFGVFLLISPATSVIAVSVMIAVYLIIGGVTLFIECLNLRNLKR